MITNLIVTAFLASIDALTSLFPSFSMPSFPAASSAISAVANLNMLFPVCTLILCITSAVVIMIALYGWDAILWVYHQFWGSD